MIGSSSDPPANANYQVFSALAALGNTVRRPKIVVSTMNVPVFLVASYFELCTAIC